MILVSLNKWLSYTDYIVYSKQYNKMQKVLTESTYYVHRCACSTVLWYNKLQINDIAKESVSIFTPKGRNKKVVRVEITIYTVL
jgi:hypothetical protein